MLNEHHLRKLGYEPSPWSDKDEDHPYIFRTWTKKLSSGYTFHIDEDLNTETLKKNFSLITSLSLPDEWRIDLPMQLINLENLFKNYNQ